MKHSQRGLTLVEVMISFSLLSLIMLCLFSTSLFFFRQNRVQTENFREKQELRMALDGVEKRLREMNRQSLVYYPKQQSFRSQMDRPNNAGKMNVWMDFSGINRNRPHTWLYFDKTSGTLRANKNQEHNVLYRNLDRVIIEEVIPGRLIRVVLEGSQGELRAELTLQLSYGRDDS